MKFSFNKCIVESIVFYSILLIGFSIPFAIKFNSITIIASFIIVVFQHTYFKKPLVFYNNIMALLMISFFVIHCISITYSSNASKGIFEIEKKLSLVIFPMIILSQQRLSVKWTKIILLGFAFSSLLFLIIHLTRLYFHDPLERVFFVEADGFNLRRAFDMYYSIHPTYLSMYLTFSVCIMAVYLKYEKVLWFKIIYLIFILTSLGFAIALGSRIVIVSIIILAFYFIFQYIGKKRLLESTVVISIVCLGLFVAYYTTPSIKNRFHEIISTEGRAPMTKAELNSTNIRFAVLACAKQVISNQNIFIGVGIGDVQDSMNNCFNSKNWVKELNDYDLHNQYLETLIGVGIIGLVLLLAIFSYCFYFGIVTNNAIMVCLMILISMVCLTESMIGIQKGIIFYFFISTILIISTLPDFNNLKGETLVKE